MADSRLYKGLMLVTAVVGAIAAVAALFITANDRAEVSPVESTVQPPTTTSVPPPANTAPIAPEVTSPPIDLVGDVPAVYLGRWVGTIDQDQLVGENSKYPTRLHIVGGVLAETVGTSSYPTLDCDADLVLVEASPMRLLVQERLRSRGTCVDDILIALTPGADGTLKFTFTQPSDGGGVLRRSP
ncbi:MAG: hypothetical protein ACRDTC_04435 [Pseudonocardiaceae bacterium]